MYADGNSVYDADNYSPEPEDPYGSGIDTSFSDPDADFGDDGF
jgi:hypothetical protein